MPDSQINELLVKHYTRTITPEEQSELNSALKAKYSFGEPMPEYRCPDCNRPLIFSWANGLICLWAQGGCGWKP